MYQYKIKPDTIFTTIEISFTNRSNHTEILHRTFLAYPDAYNFIRGHMRDYLISCFIRYVQNSINLAATASIGYYKTHDRSNALNICSKFYSDIYSFDLYTIFDWVLDNQRSLKFILPYRGSESYYTSKFQLKELSDFVIHIHKMQDKHS